MPKSGNFSPAFLGSLTPAVTSATVVMKIESSNYTGMGIFNGDILIIDRAKRITPNSLVVYESEGHFALGRVYKIKKSLEDTIVTGAVTHVIHTVKEI